MLWKHKKAQICLQQKDLLKVQTFVIPRDLSLIIDDATYFLHLFFSIWRTFWTFFESISHCWLSSQNSPLIVNDVEGRRGSPGYYKWLGGAAVADRLLESTAGGQPQTALLPGVRAMLNWIPTSIMDNNWDSLLCYYIIIKSWFEICPQINKS